MREIAHMRVADDEARLNLRMRLPALARAIGLAPIVADRVAILGCELAQESETLIVQLNEDNGKTWLSLSTHLHQQSLNLYGQLCDKVEKDLQGFTLFSWRLASMPELNWLDWRTELETPSTTALMLDLDQRSVELERKNVELAEATRLKSEFLANMSHELRTPMNSIIGFTGRVLKKASDKLDARQLRNLKTVERNAHHLLGLINDLLDISKVEAGRMELFPESTSLHDLLKEVRELTNSLWSEKGLDFNIDLNDDEITLFVDKIRLKQVLINLVSNAVKFTEQGGVSIQAECVTDSRITGAALSLEVIDTGIGMQADNLEFIFEAFRQADGSNTRAYGGTGLGLNITKNFIELMGGHIDVSSVYGEGSNFTVVIPVKQLVEGEESSVDVASAAVSTLDVEKIKIESSRGLILCIDDNADVLELFDQCLSDAGYQVVCAHSADEGLELAKKLQPSAITLDVQMPHKDGWSGLKELKDNPETKNIPVLMATMMDNRALGFKLGAVDYLEKPIVPTQLLRSIKNVRLMHETQDVLLVDDDDGVRELVTQMFEEAHLSVRQAVDGLDALVQMRAQRPDLIILDLMMPKLDGFGVIKAMQDDATLKDIPLIVSTAKVLSAKERAWLEEHAGQVMIKGGSDLDKMVGHAIEELNI